MMDLATPLLEARAISKSFAQTRALVDAHLSLRPGVTHALLGANGAGKSTLSRVISGHVRRDSGEIVYGGQSLNVRSPREALDAGIAMVMQETLLARVRVLGLVLVAGRLPGKGPGRARGSTWAAP